MQEVSIQHPSYLQDTQDFIWHIEEINKQEKLPENAMIVTWDATSLLQSHPKIKALKTQDKLQILEQIKMSQLN